MTTPPSGNSTAVPANKSTNLTKTRKEHDDFRKAFDDTKIYISLELAKRDIGFLNILISEIIKYNGFDSGDDHAFGEVTIQAQDIEWEIYDNNEGKANSARKALEMAIYRAI